MYFRHKWDRNCVLALVQKYIHRFVCVTGREHRMEEFLEGTLAFLLLPFVLFRNVILLPMPRWQCQNQISFLGSLPTSYPTQLVRSDLGISFSTQLFIKGLLRKPPTGPMLPPSPLWVASWLADCRGLEHPCCFVGWWWWGCCWLLKQAFSLLISSRHLFLKPKLQRQATFEIPQLFIRLEKLDADPQKAICYFHWVLQISRKLPFGG